MGCLFRQWAARLLKMFNLTCILLACLVLKRSIRPLRPKRAIKGFFVFQTFGRNLRKFRRAVYLKQPFISLPIDQTTTS